MIIKEYLIKEISSERELETFLRFRYQELSDSDISHVVTRNSAAIDLNYYDRNSLHYGVYLQQNDKNDPVGYFRIILEHPTKASEWAGNISLKSGLSDLIEPDSRSTFPCLGAYPYADLHQQFYRYKTPMDKVGEVSRFLISPGERSVKLSLQIIRSAFAIALSRIQYAFLLCMPEHSKAYMKFGFRQCPLSSVFRLDTAAGKKERVILYCKPKFVTPELKEYFRTMQEQFLTDGFIKFGI
jgi:hypothetical protein